MADMHSKLNEIYSLEQLSGKKTVIHNINPMVKIIVTVVYIVCLMTNNQYSLFSLSPFFFYPIVVTALAEVPYSVFLKRVLVALPFVLFAGISNIIFNREKIILFSTVVVTAGVLSFTTLIIRTVLSVWAVLLLIATTKFTDLTKQLIKIHVPVFLVNLIEMIYRYIGVLIEEASTMITAYRLRNPGYKWPHIKHMGSFVGHLFLRSFDRAQRVYDAMKCRGYGEKQNIRFNYSIKIPDVIYLVICCVSSVVFVII